MNCQKAREYIQLQLDDELPAGKRPKLARHLGDCPDCRGYQEQTALLSSAFDELAAATGATSAVRMPFTAATPHNWKTPLSLAAAIMLMLGASALVYHASRDGLLAERGGRTTQLLAGESHAAEVTRTLASARWSGPDYFMWIGLLLVLLGLTILVFRLSCRNAAVFARRVYRRL